VASPLSTDRKSESGSGDGARSQQDDAVSEDDGDWSREEEACRVRGLLLSLTTGHEGCVAWWGRIVSFWWSRGGVNALSWKRR